MSPLALSWPWALLPFTAAALLACSGETAPASAGTGGSAAATTVSTSTGSGGDGGGGGSSSTSSTGTGGAGGFTSPPLFDLTWSDATAASGLGEMATLCRAVSLGDFDEDGYPDLAIPNPPGLLLLHNDGTGTFTDWTATAAADPDVPGEDGWCGTAVADLDQDGHLDVAVGVRFGNRVQVYWGDGLGSFTPTIFGPADDSKWAVTSIGVLTRPGGPTRLLLGRFADSGSPFDLSNCSMDARGINVECIGATNPISVSTAWELGAGRNISAYAGPELAVPGYSLAQGVTDFDGDGKDDALVAMDFGIQQARRATASGFEDVGPAWGFADYGHGMGVALGDIDGDGVTDAVVTTLGGLLDYKGLGAQGFQNRGSASRLMTTPRQIWPWGSILEDFDNDGRLDLFVVNEFARDGTDPLTWLQMLGGSADYVGAFDTIFFAEADGSYSEGRLHFEDIMPNHGRGVSISSGDLDGDGRLEVILPLARAEDRHTHDVYLGHLDGRPIGHGLTVRLRGAAAASGTKVTLDCGGQKQVREIYGAEGHAGAARLDAHFGCGTSTDYASLVVTPRGHAPVTLEGGALDRSVVVDVPWGG